MRKEDGKETIIDFYQRLQWQVLKFTEYFRRRIHAIHTQTNFNDFWYMFQDCILIFGWVSKLIKSNMICVSWEKKVTDAALILDLPQNRSNFCFVLKALTWYGQGLSIFQITSSVIPADEIIKTMFYTGRQPVGKTVDGRCQSLQWQTSKLDFVNCKIKPT